MSRPTFHIRNLRALRHVDFTPEPVSVVVGENGSGKTTLLLALKLLRAMYERGPAQAVATVLRGSSGLTSHRPCMDGSVSIGADLAELRWETLLAPNGAGVDDQSGETLFDGKDAVLYTSLFGQTHHQGQVFEADKRLGLRSIIDTRLAGQPERRMAKLLQSCTVFHDFDLKLLRNGSDATQTDRLHSGGANAVAMMRLWNQSKPDRFRHEFVLEGLRAAFPGLLDDIDYQEAGQTVAMRLWPAGGETHVPLMFAANGVLSMLVSLCALAGADKGAVVAIDEPEHGLHPFAIRRLVEAARGFAQQRDLTVIFSTHSPALLDEFTASPEAIFVLQPNAETNLVRATDLYDPEWLSLFQAGERLIQGDFGSNEAGT